MPCDPIRIDETLQELNTHGSDLFPFEFCLSVYGEGYDHSFPWHWHREFELVVVTRGETDCLIGSNRLSLRCGGGLLIRPGVVHSYETPVSVEMPTVLFRPEFIAPEGSAIFDRFVTPFLHSCLSYVLLKPEVPWQREILEAVLSIGHLDASPTPTPELDQHTLVCGLWRALYPHLGELESTSGHTGPSMLLQARLRKMIAFLEANFDRKLTLADISHAASVSPSEALRCFRAGVHTTPIDYLSRYRLNRARARLTESGLPITDIAAESGFSSPAYFDRLFRRAFGVSPREYRSAHRTL